jgi:hypothetical protein
MFAEVAQVLGLRINDYEAITEQDMILEWQPVE